MERPYLSIGEVLELLKHEFPDVSISRIRALESGGHLELERTASGYRKFYDADVAYLRTLLRGGVASGLSGAPVDGSVAVSLPGPQVDGAEPRTLDRPLDRAPKSRPSSVRSGRSPVSIDAGLGRSDVSDPSDGIDLPDHPIEVHVVGPDGELPGNPERRHPAALAALRRANAAAFGGNSNAWVGQRPEASGRSGSPVVDQKSSEPPALVLVEPVTAPDTVVASDQVVTPDPVVAPGSPVVSTLAGPSLSVEVPGPSLSVEVAGPARNPLAVNPSGLNLSLDELSKATGVSIETIRELESLGLLRGQGVFSTVYYDEDSLLTCRLVAQFQTYGVEPRHLRMYKLAADREAAFFEQVVTPQLRRKNPDAREKAVETLGELVRLGEQLRVVALRQVLRAAVDRP